MKTKVKNIMLDMLTTIKIATIAFLIVAVVFGGIALIVYKGQLIPSLDIIRAALFVIAAVGLIITSALILKRDGSDSWDDKLDWEERFKCMSMRTFIGLFSGFILSYGCIIDYIRYVLK